jgi:hypothetical protein
MTRWIASLLLALLCFVSVPAHARQWVRAEIPGAVLYSDGYPHELQRWALKLRLFDALLRQQFALAGPDADEGSPLTVYLLDEGKDVERLTGLENVHGLYSPSSEGSFLIASRAPGYEKERLSGQNVLFHEYAHHFMYRHFTSAWPAWYREGLAEYAGAVTFDIDWNAIVGQPNWPRLRHLDGKPMPLPMILTASVDDFEPDEKARFYSWSWKLVYLLSGSAEDRQTLDRYLRLFSSDIEPAEAARSAFGDIGAMEARLHALAVDPRGGQKVALEARPSADIPVTTVDSAASLLIDLRLSRMAARDRKRAVAGLLAFVAAYPANAEARRELALALQDTDLAAASEQAAQAVTLAPGDLRARAVWADLAMRRTKANPGATAADWDSLRATLAKATGANRRDPMALSLLFRSYLMEARPAPPAAHEAIDEALNLQPESYELRSLAVYSLAMRGRLDDARRAASVLASDPHSGALGKRALDMLARLQSSRDLSCRPGTSGAITC